jgi:hypothetical protein
MASNSKAPVHSTTAPSTTTPVMVQLPPTGNVQLVGNNQPATQPLRVYPPTGNVGTPAMPPAPGNANAPIMRNPYYTAPQGVNPVGNPNFITVVTLCNLATHMGATVGKAVQLCGGEPAHPRTPHPAFIPVVSGGRKYVPATCVPVLAQLCNYTGPITPAMYTTRKTR